NVQSAKAIPIHLPNRRWVLTSPSTNSPRQGLTGRKCPEGSGTACHRGLQLVVHTTKLKGSPVDAEQRVVDQELKDQALATSRWNGLVQSARVGDEHCACLADDLNHPVRTECIQDFFVF